jgi:hypothetical protein
LKDKLLTQATPWFQSWWNGEEEIIIYVEFIFLTTGGALCHSNCLALNHRHCVAVVSCLFSVSIPD